MIQNAIAHPKIVERDEWLTARKTLLKHEKELTKQRDRINAERRRLPMVKLEKEYVFEGANGSAKLIDLFAGRTQLNHLPLHVCSGMGQGLYGLHGLC